jgi:hypothetical protein
MLAAVAAGCSDSTAPEEVTVDDLVGTWNATRATFDEVAGDGTFDAIPDIPGVSMSITVASGGAYTITTAAPGETPEVETGTLTVANGVITTTPSDPLEDPEQIDILSLSGDGLTVFFEDEEWDFTDDSVDNETPATLTVVLRRQ